MSIRAVAVHQLIAHLVLPVPLQHGSKLVRFPIAVEPVLGLRILHQPIDHPLKVLVLALIDLVDLGGLHLPSTPASKENYICMSK
jgi:hypothetical protein